MADTDAKLGRIHDHEADDRGGGKPLRTPSAACRRLDLPKVDGKEQAVRAPRTAKVVMPFMDEMTDDAMAEFRKRMAAEHESDPTNVASRTA